MADKAKPTADLLGKRLADTLPPEVLSALPSAVQESGVWGEPTYGGITDAWRAEDNVESRVLALLIQNPQGGLMMSYEEIRALPMRAAFRLNRCAGFIESLTADALEGIEDDEEKKPDSSAT